MAPWYFNSILLTLGPLQIHWYGVMYAIAFVAGYFWLHHSYFGKKLGLNSDQRDIFLIAVILGVLVGGRVGYILFYNLPYYVSNPAKILAVWEGGMSFHGGFLGVAIAILWFAKKYKVRVFALSDLVTSIAPVGLFLGRLGNFMNG